MSDPDRHSDVRKEYDAIARTYDRRYEINPLTGVEAALRHLVKEVGARRVLEIGCGTGHWLKILAPQVDWIIGLDPSLGMLKVAAELQPPGELVCASASALPFAGGSFDLIFVVNALHHFDDKRSFVEEARRLLRPGGALATIGMDLPSAVGHWVIYDYFPVTIEYDRSRFPPWEQIESWMRGAGFIVRPPRTVEHVRNQKRGREILDDHFIQRSGASQLRGLTDAQYRAGMERIKAAISEAEARGEEAVFKTDLQLKILVGHVPMNLSRSHASNV
jgi:ubiquinone/menaquinone biosynthesis C-methylase UbiE